ncbi:hypothetical protein RBG61_09150 [Paludicola sp. MB14-C6]|nr:hypothetical protein [Paludicola sp. MB14-C6]WMJ24461.1 hypothetical protein RBG61_09150 [Paludicola sp. MB14-C6]
MPDLPALLPSPKTYKELLKRQNDSQSRGFIL